MKRLGVAIGFVWAGHVVACGARSEILDRELHHAATADDSGADADDGGDDATYAPAPQDTGPASDVAAPAPPPFRVVSTTPAPDATGVGANASLVVRFSTDVTMASLGGAITLSDGNGNVSGSLSTSGMTATFRPSAALPLACTEAAAVAASATDITGQRLGATYRWQFTTADGAWGVEQSASGMGYTSGGNMAPAQNRPGIAGDGSAFVSWSDYDTTGQHLYLHGSRYAPGTGWAPHLQFTEIYQAGIYGGGSLMQAVSADGEAVFLWDGPAVGDAGGVVHHVNWLHYGTDWDSAPGVLASDAYPLATGADASGNFFAIWLEPATGTIRNVRMARYAHGTGWGSVEKPSTVYTGTGSVVSPQGASLSTAPDGHALVAWVEGNTSTGPWWIRVERYVPGSGWGGVEALTSGTTGIGSVGALATAVGTDGSAAVSWRQLTMTPSTYRTMVSTFSGTWSSPTVLSSGSTAGTQVFTPLLGTDGRGTFLSVWVQRDGTVNQVYASRFAAKSKAWATTTVVEGVPMDAGTPTITLSAPLFAMGPSGDAVVASREYNSTTGVFSLDAVTYSTSGGWSSPTRLETDTNAIAAPLVDACGNATLVWTRRTDISVWSSRLVHGGSWSTPARLDRSNLVVTNGQIADGVGANGDVIASWTSQQGYNMAAAILR
jgi:hypothetical protein